jgi:hypothetical protein
MKANQRRRFSRWAATVVMLVGVEAASAQPTISPEVAADVLSGPWTMTLKVPIRGCKVDLTDKPAAKPAGALAATIPQRCRWAVPALAKAAAWTLSEKNWPTFVDANGAEVMGFERIVGPMLAGKVGANDYTMEAFGTGVVADNDRRHAIANLLAGKELPQTRALAAIDPKQVPGNYGVARDKGRPICSIALASSAGARAGAQIAGGCLDAGLKIFDPVAWRLDKGRLVLVARKGHETAFTLAEDGTWTKDPPGGSPMFLKKQ